MLTRRHVLAGLLAYPAAIGLGRFLRGPRSLIDLSRSVIVTSDDAGMCQSVNEGTIQAMLGGVVSSASIMACCPSFDEFADFAVRYPQFDYGVHLVLTCDLRETPWGPVSGSSKAPTLVDENGAFRLWPGDDINILEVEHELRAQIEKVKGAGIRVTHLDHHMWVMFHSKETLTLYVKLGIEYGLPIRFSHVIPAQIARRGKEFITTYNKQIEILRSSDLPVLQFVEAQNYSVDPLYKREYFIDQLQQLPCGISEIATHCAAPLRASAAAPPDLAKRCADTAFWSSPEARQLLEEGGIKPVTWAEIVG